MRRASSSGYRLRRERVSFKRTPPMMKQPAVIAVLLRPLKVLAKVFLVEGRSLTAGWRAKRGEEGARGAGGSVPRWVGEGGKRV